MEHGQRWPVVNVCKCFVYSEEWPERERAASASLLQVEGGWMWMVGVGGIHGGEMWYDSAENV